jgi:transcription initiation factor TFIIE subunit beta
VPALRTYIRTNSTPLQGVPVKILKEALPAGGPISITALEELEAKGDLMIMRGLTGQEFKDVALPALGQKNAFGIGITEGRNERWKTVWWDDLKERGRAGKRQPQGEQLQAITLMIDMITAWDKVKIAENDDISKLLAGREFSHLWTKLTNRGAKLEHGGREANHCTSTEKEEESDESAKDYQYSYERSSE